MSDCLIDEEELTGLARIEPLLETMGTDESFDTSKLQYHPLMAPEILKKVFNNLKSKDLANCRLVCRTWGDEVTKDPSKEFNLILYADRNLTNFFKLMKNPYANFPSRHVILEDNERASLGNPQVLGFLETFGDSIRSLVLNTNHSLNFLSLFLLPKLCKRLETLGFEILTSNSDHFPNLFYSTKPFEDDIGRNSFYSLKNLMVTMSGDPLSITENDTTVGVFIDQILDKSPNLVGLSLTEFSSQNLSLISSRLVAKHLYIVQNLTNLRVDGHEEYFSRLIGVKLNLKWLHLPAVSFDLKTTTFAKILEATCHSLESLIVTNDYMKFAGICFNVQFNREMKRLARLQVDDVICVCGGEAKGGLFKLLPALVDFQFVSEEIETYLSDSKRLELWNFLFPNEPVKVKETGMSLEACDGGGALKHLRELWVCTRLNLPYVISKIQKTFPSLSCLKLEIEDNLFSEVIFKLKDLPIKRLTLRCLEHSDGGIMSFTSALTGIDKDICDRLLSKPIVEHEDLMGQLGLEEGSGIKRSCCLEDWKRLSKLEISYKTKEGGMVDLNRLAICEGFLKIKNLTILRLRHFEIEERFVIKMLKKLPLTELCLTCCNIFDQMRIQSKNSCNSIIQLLPYSDHHESEINKKISGRFPNVTFVYESD